MRLLRRGDSGPAVAEVCTLLQQFGLLARTVSPPQTFDNAVQRAVCEFQQQRGLIADGVVGAATYRALRDARWRLGVRLLALMIPAPVTRDDVVMLQERQL